MHNYLRREVSSKILERLLSAVNLITKLMDELSVLENDIPSQQVEVIQSIELEELKDIAEKRWNGYIENSNITILSPNNICNEELLSLYFDGKYPFSSGKKKNEFPDAISLLSLKSWIEKENQKIYVVSHDPDLHGFCQNDNRYISINKLTEFLDIYNRTEERLTAIVHKYIENEIEWISEVIEESFAECGFEYSNNWEAEIENIDIQSVEIIDIDIIEVQDEKAVINLRTRIDFSADISGPDYENAIWDSEDKEYFFVDSFDENSSFSEVYDISMVAFFDEKKGEFTKMEDIQFDGSKNITLDYDDGYPYK